MYLLIDTTSFNADNKPNRALLFIALAASGWAPVAHMAFISGLPGVQNFPTQEWGAMAMFYLAGVIVYVTRVPERYFPGTFDIWVSKSTQALALLSKWQEKLSTDKVCVVGS